jgi:uncharacterized protein (DUF2141 family)
MKKIFFTLMIVASYSYAATINITIDNILNNKGNIRFALFSLKNADKFPFNKKGYQTITNNETNKVVQGIIEPAQKGSMNFSISVPTGIYAISAIHDENSNEELDRNFFGSPTEPYGFSNDARATFSPPDYEEAQFTLTEEDLNIALVLE